MNKNSIIRQNDDDDNTIIIILNTLAVRGHGPNLPELLSGRAERRGPFARESCGRT